VPITVSVVVELSVGKSDDRTAQPSIADEVEDREVLRRSQRVVERQQHDTEPDQEVMGDSGNRRTQDDGRREIAIVAGVVLGEGHRREAPLVGPGALPQGSLVEVDGSRSERGGSHVVGERDFHSWSPFRLVLKRPIV